MICCGVTKPMFSIGVSTLWKTNEGPLTSQGLSICIEQHAKSFALQPVEVSKVVMLAVFSPALHYVYRS